MLVALVENGRARANVLGLWVHQNWKKTIFTPSSSSSLTLSPCCRLTWWPWRSWEVWELWGRIDRTSRPLAWSASRSLRTHFHWWPCSQTWKKSQSLKLLVQSFVDWGTCWKTTQSRLGGPWPTFVRRSRKWKRRGRCIQQYLKISQSCK